MLSWTLEGKNYQTSVSGTFFRRMTEQVVASIVVSVVVLFLAAVGAGVYSLLVKTDQPVTDQPKYPIQQFEPASPSAPAPADSNIPIEFLTSTLRGIPVYSSSEAEVVGSVNEVVFDSGGHSYLVFEDKSSMKQKVVPIGVVKVEKQSGSSSPRKVIVSGTVLQLAPLYSPIIR